MGYGRSPMVQLEKICQKWEDTHGDTKRLLSLSMVISGTAVAACSVMVLESYGSVIEILVELWESFAPAPFSFLMR